MSYLTFFFSRHWWNALHRKPERKTFLKVCDADDDEFYCNYAATLETGITVPVPLHAEFVDKRVQIVTAESQKTYV